MLVIVNTLRLGLPCCYDASMCPTRYVTGFYVTESDPIASNGWIARNKDAHAWVEAWDADKQTWRIVESTVQNLLEEDQANTANHLTGFNRFVFIQKLNTGSVSIWCAGHPGLDV